MAKATWVQTNFNAGEWTPLAHGRFDIAKYKNGLAECLNFMPTQQGGLTKRPGTRFVAAVKDSSYAPRLIRFEFSIEQAYILEFGDHYIRFFANDAPILVPTPSGNYASGVSYVVGDVVYWLGTVYVCKVAHLSSGGSIPIDGGSTNWIQVSGSPGDVLSIPTDYSPAQAWELNFTQSADVLYVTHKDKFPRKLNRYASYGWEFVAVSFLDGPYLNVNTTSTTLTPSDTTGLVTVTASSTDGINRGVGFRSSDEGRLLRIKCGGVWLWGPIVIVGTPTSCTWDIQPAIAGRVPSTATATANVSGGSVFGFTITDGGSGYGATPPSVIITPHNADPAVIALTIVAGVITAASITYGGTGYFTDPVVVLSGTGGGTGAQISVFTNGTGSIVDIFVNNGGSGYAPGTTASAPGYGSGGGSGAVAYATLTNGVVTGITVSVTGTGYTSGADVTLTPPTALAPSITSFWRLGEWNSVDGYPSCVAFHQDRLCFSGNAQNPGRVDGSNIGDYENFAPTNQDGTIVDSNALSFTLNAGSVNVIRWLMSDENGLLIGTSGGEWIISPSSSQQALTPTNVNAKPLGNYGSAIVPPVRVGKATLFVQRTGRKLREMFYQFTYNTFMSPDISLVSEHLTKGGIKQMALQLAPQQIVWFSRSNGGFSGMTYDKDQEVCGWHGHKLGGFSDEGQTEAPLIESVAGIPAPNIQRDEVWVVVKRYINGAVSRTIEVMAKPWEDGDLVEDAVFLDSSAVYDGAPTTAISGLTWLKGQTVSVLADGAVHPDRVVDNTGGITLQRSASKVQVGLGYVARGKTLRIEAGGADGPSQGKTKRIFRTIFRFFQSVGFELMSSAPGIGFYPVPFRDSGDLMGQPVPLFDGDKRWSYDGTWESDGYVYFQSSSPLPCNITLLMAQLDTQDNQ